ncbi:MAG: hypothetical protein PHO08_13015 [Methylococcales bacterium]|nr:hypothetical protein [Methylococcales bacterium]MDD5631927.1 hypothetical protein [Methylococcales bacterium]
MTKSFKKRAYIAQNIEMIRSAAYENLSGNAVKLLILMQTHWRMYEPIAYSISEAQKRIGCCRGKAHAAFKELESHGFIKLMLEGHFYKQLGGSGGLPSVSLTITSLLTNGETGHLEIDLLIHYMNTSCRIVNKSYRIVNRCS